MPASRHLRTAVAVVACTLTGVGTVAALSSPAAAQSDPHVRWSNPLSPSSAAAETLVTSVEADRGAFGLSAAQALTPVTAASDSTGTTHVRVTQTYHGLPVIGGDLVIHRDAAGKTTSISRTLTKPLTLGTTAKVAKPAAKSLPELVIDTLTGTPRLAWQITTVGKQKDGTPSRKLTYIDANTGATVRTEERIMTVDGSGNSLYGGTVGLQLAPSGTSYLLKDPTRGNTYTTDMQNKTDGFFCSYFGAGCQAGTTFSSTDTIFGTGATTSRESAAVDAQYGTNVTWDYYKNTFGRNGIFGTGKGSFNRVHYGSNYVNAFWDGTTMTYGDGDGTTYGPLTSLDVAGHEMSHGVTENTANLTYSGESGGLNESTSDIFGTMVEFSAANAKDKGDYIIGEAFDKTGKGLRRMDNPASDGKSANCYSTGTKNLDVHYSSGVGNHFYYLLAEGSGAKTINGIAHNSPTCNNSTITGIGRSDAQQIWYRALSVYMTSGTTYSGARTATLNAAKDLFGATSTQYNTVAAAWSAVSVS